MCVLGTKKLNSRLKLIALAGNRTRAARVAGEHSTTEPPVLSSEWAQGVDMTMSWFRAWAWADQLGSLCIRRNWVGENRCFSYQSIVRPFRGAHRYIFCSQLPYNRLRWHRYIDNQFCIGCSVNEIVETVDRTKLLLIKLEVMIGLRC